MNIKLSKRLAVISVLLGIAHAVVVAGMHSTVLPSMWFFIVGGFMQVTWGIRQWKDITNTGKWLGLLLHGGLTVLWLITRLYDAPFHGGPESFALLDIALGIGQGIIVVLLLKALHVKHVFAGLLGVFVSGWFLYGLGVGGELLLPAYANTSHGHNSGGHSGSPGHHNKPDNEKKQTKPVKNDDGDFVMGDNADDQKEGGFSGTDIEIENSADDDHDDNDDHHDDDNGRGH